MTEMQKTDLKKINDYLWEIPLGFRSDMKVPARIYASEKILEGIFRDRSLEQLLNVAALPGIVDRAIVMPDAHEGYGFPIGGVAAMKIPDGLISPGGVGYDINCGVRLLRLNLSYRQIKGDLGHLTSQIQCDVPSGVGRGGREIFRGPDMDKIIEGGARRAVELGFGEDDDLKHCESGGFLEGADASKVSGKAKARGADQVGTIGAGNHFIEIQRVETIFDEAAARSFGLSRDGITVMIHTGSRGLGHQIATEYIQLMMRAMIKYKIDLPDRELAAASFNSPEGQDYFSAMKCGANFAWANRQRIAHLVRGSFKEILGDGAALKIIYDVAHNIAKVEKYDGRELLVHRKGATRAFGPNHPELPAAYRDLGQPVIIPGSMGTASYVLLGTEQSMKEAFGSSCHGAGRTMSRHAALRKVRGEALKEELESRGIEVRGGSWRGLAEEAPVAYKDIDAVVETVVGAGIARKVARLVPVGVVKG